MATLLFPFRHLAMWLVWNVPLGLAAPAFFNFAMGQKGRKVD